MRVVKSPLILEEVYIVASNIVAIPMSDGFSGEINDFDIDIDFEVFTDNDDSDDRKVVVSIKGNDIENPAPGYVFSIVAEGVFNYNKSVKISKKDKDILLTHSAVPIVIGHIRSYLSTLSALGPFGTFLLPSVDMNNLLNGKKKAMNAENKKDQ